MGGIGCWLAPWLWAYLRWLQEDEDEEGQVDGDGSSNKKKVEGCSAKVKDAKKVKKGKAAKTKPPATKAKEVENAKKGNDEDQAETAYQAGDYSQRRKCWIQKRRNNLGMSYRDASAAWNSSKTRERLLQGMSYSEKVRRRFV